LLVGVGKILGARKGEAGDTSLVIDAFAKVPVNIILWQGDDELNRKSIYFLTPISWIT